MNEHKGWVFCGGMFRSASTLQFLVTCDIVLSAHAGIRAREKIDAFNLAFKKYNHYEGYKVYKTHYFSDEVKNLIYNDKSKIIYIYRDIRDVLVSYMQESNTPIAKLIDAGWGDIAIDNFYKWTDCPNVLIMRYETDSIDIQAMVRKISTYLEVDLTDDIIDRISFRHTTKSHLKEINNAKVENRLQKESPDSISYDPLTLLHEHHIADGKTGKWKHILSLKEVEIINNRWKNWLEKQSYLV